MNLVQQIDCALDRKLGFDGRFLKGVESLLALCEFGCRGLEPLFILLVPSLRCWSFRVLNVSPRGWRLCAHVWEKGIGDGGCGMDRMGRDGGADVEEMKSGMRAWQQGRRGTPASHDG